MANKSFTIALAQLAGSAESTANVKRVAAAMETARQAEQCPDLLVFPEGYLTGFYVDDAKRCALTVAAAHAELSEIAAGHQVALAVGYLEQEGDTLFSAALILDSYGKELAKYRKCFLYGNWEKTTFAADNKICVFDLCGFRIGLCICYDIEFPETARRLALAGAEIIIAPTALMASDEELVFKLLPARAIENGVFVAYANRVGRERELRYVGGSRILDRSGKILAQASSDSEDIIRKTLIIPANAERSAYLHDVLLENKTYWA